MGATRWVTPFGCAAAAHRDRQIVVVPEARGRAGRLALIRRPNLLAVHVTRGKIALDAHPAGGFVQTIDVGDTALKAAAPDLLLLQSLRHRDVRLSRRPPFREVDP